MKNLPTRLSHLELEILRPLWQLKQATIREIRDALPKDRRPEYTTVQTIVYRLEEKGAVERVKKIGNAHVFTPAVSHKSTVGALVEDLVRRLGGTAEPVMAHLIESGRIGLKELRELEALLPQPKYPRKQ